MSARRPQSRSVVPGPTERDAPVFDVTDGAGEVPALRDDALFEMLARSNFRIYVKRHGTKDVGQWADVMGGANGVVVCLLCSRRMAETAMWHGGWAGRFLSSAGKAAIEDHAAWHRRRGR